MTQLITLYVSRRTNARDNDRRTCGRIGQPSFYIPAFVREPILAGRTLARGIYMRTDSIIDIMMKRTTNEDTNPHESNDVSSTKTRKYDLTDMLSRMNQSNCHSEHKTGAAQDKEEW